MNLFIYGTFKRGHSRSCLLDGQRFCGEAVTAPRFRLFSVYGRYPALVEASHVDLPGLAIEGEVWRVTDECLAVLDQVEGVAAGLFERKAVELADHHGHVEAYFGGGHIEGVVDCGDCW